MVYYRIPIDTGLVFPAGCILCCAYQYSGEMYCKFERVTSVGTNWVKITEAEFEVRCPDFPAPDSPPVQEIIATSATIASGSVVLALPASVDTGTLVKFTAPCACSAVTNGIAIDGETYSVVDAMGKIVNGKDGVWTGGAQVAVIIDKANKRAYVQNAGKAIPTHEDVGAASKDHKHSATDINTGTLSSDRLPVVPIDKGGHGASNGSDGLKNLLAAGPMIISPHQLVDELPTDRVHGRLLLLKVKKVSS